MGLPVKCPTQSEFAMFGGRALKIAKVTTILCERTFKAFRHPIDLRHILVHVFDFKGERVVGFPDGGIPSLANPGDALGLIRIIAVEFHTFVLFGLFIKPKRKFFLFG